MMKFYKETTCICIFFLTHIVSGYVNDNSLACTSGIQTFNEHRHKRKYRVGVHAIRGFEAAIREYNKTYGEYLSATAGQRFNPPIEFEMVPMTFEGIFEAADSEDLDFFYANPSIFSCVGTEVGAQPLATIVSRLEVRGRTFDLDVFGGVIATQKDNNDINSILDLKDKIIGAGSISMVMAAQLQFYEMELAGLSYVMDPKQVVFTGNQFDVVNGVLDGEFDVGFVRTDQIERTKDQNGVPIDPELFKIIEPKIHILDDGDLFPFLHSTSIYPEWPVASLPHVPSDVTKEVQNALLAVGEHAQVGQLYKECLEQYNETHCDGLPFPNSFDSNARCDTSKSLAMLALEASQVGKWAGFRTTRSYAELRTMQETAGFISKDEKGNWKCMRSSSLYDEIQCPEGHFKRSRAAFEDGCNQIGLPCKEDYDCFCKPCVKSFEVELYQYNHGEEDHRIADNYFGGMQGGCGKMSLCGVAEQTKMMTLRAYDNIERADANITAVIHAGEETLHLPVIRIGNTFAYEFNITCNEVGYYIIEIFANEDQIKESPIRVHVVERDCDKDFIGEGRIPDRVGTCVCRRSAMEIGGRCVSATIFFSICATIVLLVALQIGYIYLNHKKRQADTMWLVNVDELHFNQPVDIIGQGSFGVVLLAEYRGTKVAVKRVLPPREQRRGGSNNCDSLSRDSVDKAKPLDRRQSIAAVDLEAQEEVNDLYCSTEKLDSSWSFSFGSSKGMITNMFSNWFNTHDTQVKNTNILVSASVGSSKRITNWFYLFDEHSRHKKDFIVEMRLLSRLRHPCITTVMGAVVSTFHEPMLVMEYMDYGSLYDLLRNETMHMGGEVILQIVRDIVHGLRYLHASKPPILHGDLKAKNILVDSRFRAKVADFGLSLSKTKRSKGLQGTFYWMAPEYLRRKSEYNSQCDIYSLGIVLYEIYARKTPYEGENIKQVLSRVCNPRINQRPDIPEGCPPKMLDIIKKCWSPDPIFRPTAKDLDLLFMDMNMHDVDIQSKDEQQGTIQNSRTTKDMLYEVFPTHIADALSSGKKVEPESHDVVTVIFSDIVGFTTISKEISPLKISNMLDRLYLAFDGLARNHGIFKVETIGDAYMGVTNLNGSQKDDHVKRIAEFGLALIDVAGRVLIDEEDSAKGHIQLRVGFHSGPVVSNVIGSLNPRYGLFGDTVNTASRMETNSSTDRILCSDRSAALLKKQANHISLTRRGRISVKGKGDMVTYWVDNGDKKQDFEKKETPSMEVKVTDGQQNINQSKDDNKALQARVTFNEDNLKIDRETMSCTKSEDKKVLSNNIVENQISTLQKNSIQPDESIDENLETQHLVDWMVEILLDQIKKIVAMRNATNATTTEPTTKYTNSSHSHSSSSCSHSLMSSSEMSNKTETCCLDEMKNIIDIPRFNPMNVAALVDITNGGMYRSIQICPSIITELKEFVNLIASTYNRYNRFHNFEHACHVTMSANKLLQYIIKPSEGNSVVNKDNNHDGNNNNDDDDDDDDDKQKFDLIEFIKKNGNNKNNNKNNSNRLLDYASYLHNVTNGIASDPLISFALLFSALIHDVDHKGISNEQLMIEQPKLAYKYRNKCIAEQNSFDIAWEILMFEQFNKLREYIFGTSNMNDKELLRFRQLVINMVLSTAIFDKEMNELRMKRWNKAFHSTNTSATMTKKRTYYNYPGDNDNIIDVDNDNNNEINDLRATMIIEHMIQVSDVSHTMQHWKVYQKWNKQLFQEIYNAYCEKRLCSSSTNPIHWWYQGELNFFDTYVIPLATRIKECNMFGHCGDECLNYAISNRAKWALCGKDIIKEIIPILGERNDICSHHHPTNNCDDCHDGDNDDTRNEE